MKTINLTALFMLISLPLFSQLSGFFDDFEDGSVDTIWNDSTYTLLMADHPGTFGITENDGFLNIAYTRTAESAAADKKAAWKHTPPPPRQQKELPRRSKPV